MIARIWRGWTSPENADAYEEHFRTSVQAELRGVEGFVEAQLLRRVVGDEIEFVAISYWDSIEAVRRFAGEEYEVAVVAPQARDVLTRFEDRVAHFKVALVTPATKRSVP
jgi:heme-degrading monooxygenase HmoA